MFLEANYKLIFGCFLYFLNTDQFVRKSESAVETGTKQKTSFTIPTEYCIAIGVAINDIRRIYS